MSVRINDLKKWIRKTIKEKKPDIVLIEDIQFQTNKKVFKTLAQLQGVLIDLFVELGVEYEIVNCATWKSVVGIKQRGRKEEKKESIRIASEFVGEEVHEDTADAICIALCEVKRRFED